MADLPTYETKPEPTEHRTPVLSYGLPIDPVMALRNCEVGKSFVVDREWDRKRMFNVARQLGFKVKTRKEEHDTDFNQKVTRIRIWRKK